MTRIISHKLHTEYKASYHKLCDLINGRDILEKYRLDHDINHSLKCLNDSIRWTLRNLLEEAVSPVRGHINDWVDAYWSTRERREAEERLMLALQEAIKDEHCEECRIADEATDA